MSLLNWNCGIVKSLGVNLTIHYLKDVMQMYQPFAVLFPN